VVVIRVVLVVEHDVLAANRRGTLESVPAVHVSPVIRAPACAARQL
jgi:hypothetical protein